MAFRLDKKKIRRVRRIASPTRFPLITRLNALPQKRLKL